jgi:hypothetical protein
MISIFSSIIEKKEKRTVDSSSHSHSSGQSVSCCQPKNETGLEYVSNPRLVYTSKLAFFFFSVFFPSEALLCYMYFFHLVEKRRFGNIYANRSRVARRILSRVIYAYMKCYKV